MPGGPAPRGHRDRIDGLGPAALAPRALPKKNSRYNARPHSIAGRDPPWPKLESSWALERARVWAGRSVPASRSRGPGGLRRRPNGQQARRSVYRSPRGGGSTAHPVVTDTTVEAEVEALFASVASAGDTVELVAYNAGNANPGALLELDAAGLRGRLARVLSRAASWSAAPPPAPWCPGAVR